MGGRKRILYIDLAPAIGGSVISLYHLVRGLDRERYEPHVVLRSSNGYAARFEELGVPVTTIGGGAASPSASAEAGAWSGVRRGRMARWLKRSVWGESLVHFIGFYLRAWPVLRREAGALAEIMRTVQPDLVHLNDIVCVCRAGIMAARATRVPAICHLRAMDERNHFDRWLSRSLRGYLCISRAVDQHQRQLGGRIEPSWIVYNGIDPDEFTGVVDRAAVRAELGLHDDHQVIGCVGRLVAWKGQDVFLRALAQLAAERPSLRGLVVGAAGPNDQGYAKALHDETQALGLVGRVVFTGFRGDIARLLRSMDVLIHASTSPEPFGRVIIEGMAAGTVVVAAHAGAVPEIIEDGVTGWLVPPGDAEAMARAIGRALDRPQESEALRRAARRAVEQRFTAAQTVRGVEQVYEDILGDQDTGR